MKYFTLDDANDIAVFKSPEEAAAHCSDVFSTREELESLTGLRGSAEMIAIYNGIPGTIPVKKFGSTALAIKAIWDALGELPDPGEHIEEFPETTTTTTTEQAGEAGSPKEDAMTTKKKKSKGGAKSAPKEKAPKKLKEKAAKKPKGEPKQPKASKATKKAPKAKGGPAVAREGSKTEAVLVLLRRPKGATLAELMKETGWEATASVRGFISGTIGKKMGLKVESTRDEKTKERTYRVVA